MTTLYYFSATGNCLTTAREIAEQLGDCCIVSVTSLREMSVIRDESDMVGFIFPVYYGNMPYPMRETIRKMELRQDAYVFVFTTCRGHVGVAPQRVDALLKEKGQKLSLALNVQMPGNSWISTPEENAERLAAQKDAIAAQMDQIRSREVQDYTPQEELQSTPVDQPNNFRGIMADENCVGCGTCVMVCPMENIHLADGRAQIGDRCATCLACFHWCPVEAIYMSKEEQVGRRFKYHHPDVKLSDMVRKG